MGTMVKEIDCRMMLLWAFCFLILLSNIDFDDAAIHICDDKIEADGLRESYPPLLVRTTRSPGPDLTLDPPVVITDDSENITFSIQEPNEGETVLINSTVTNNGDENATALVEFYDGHPDEEDLIGSDTVFVEPGLSIPVSTQWNTSGEDEDHIIYVVVDPEDVVNETDESNNIVQKGIIVNQVPLADAGDDLLAFVDHPVLLDGSGSWDSSSDIDVLNYTWEFGDGTTGYGEIVEHTYLEDGTFTVTLAVRDNGLALGLDMITIEVRHLPIQITLAENLKPLSCRPGQEVEISGSIEIEFSPAIPDIEIPLLTVKIEIPETGSNWSTQSDVNGNYRVYITAPNSTGTYTVEASITYGPIYRSTSKVLAVSEGKSASFFTVESGFIVIVLAAMAVLGIIYGGSELGRYSILLIIFVPLYTRIKKDKVLDHFHRGRLFNYIELHPGVTFTELKKKFSFKNGNLVYHLNFLEKTEFIKSFKEGRHRRFYLKGDFSRTEDFSIYVNDIQKKIISVIEQNPGVTQSRIAAILGTSRQKISYNINTLDYAGLIHSVREGSRKIRYYPVEAEGKAT
ncbi:MAG: winged helix-turn-helix transcriptional regulator [Thermoplasmata archaeon]|nr:MAG: winged helix-turn-helix transcriptional regulator [Thermoplasmata archaeon]